MERIVCGIDGTPATLEGVRQAAALAEADALLELVAVVDDLGCVAGNRDVHADELLAEARAEAGACGANIATRRVNGDGGFVWDRLLDAAAGADLLVLARSAQATAALARAQLPVLFATRPPDSAPFPERILVAAGGPGHPEDAVRLAADIAQRHRSDVVLLRADGAGSAMRNGHADDTAAVLEATGRAPIEIVAAGRPERAIAKYAKLEGVSLVITGSRGKIPLARLRSVSGRVVRSSPCSVLVIRAPQPDDRGLPYA